MSDEPVTVEESLFESDRFAFGKNWQRFSEDLTEKQIRVAERSLTEMLGDHSLANCTFLDIGSGSGLFSLAAIRLGADHVVSFDFDPASVRCAVDLRAELPADTAQRWLVERGNAIDPSYMGGLGQFDVVYAWGSLHHTGNLWGALDLACARAEPGGRLFLSLYNDQGARSRAWHAIKRLYNSLPHPLRVPFVIAVMMPFEIRAAAGYTAKLQTQEYLRAWKRGERARGMSRWHDLIDWVGGFPFEVAKPGDVLEFCRQRGFELLRLQTCGGGWGCNQYVFRRQVDG
jgi:SAM-dependent methyltransferase